MAIALKPLNEQVIVVTGASSGIGLATSRAAARAGAKVLLVARNAEALQEAVDGIVAEGGTADFAVADVGKLDEVEAAAAQAIQRFGRIDTWVNDAGVAIYAKLVDTPMAEHEQLFRTNYFGVVHGALTALRHLQGGGALITVGSIASSLPTPILGAYAASKHAVKGYIDSLRMELTADKAPISLTLIKPAGIDTPIGQHAANHLAGEALVPPPTYDPVLVAEAILDAAVTPRREVTVGGVGMLEILFGTHFPAVRDRMAALMIPGASDPKRPKTQGDALWSPGADGRLHSGINHPRQTSLYTAAARHKGALTIGAAIGIGALFVARRRGRDAD